MNNKGFTMVELLVAMAIMGLLIIMAFPTIRAIQANNTDTKYEEYGKSVISAAKLYVDSYGEDIFDPNRKNQRVIVKIDKLVEKDLIKDINVSDTSCLNGEANVWIVKYDNDYSYCLHLTCKAGDTVVYESKDTKGSCKGISDKIKTVTYKYGDKEYVDEVLLDDTDYVILSPERVGFNILGDHRTFHYWQESGKDNKAPNTKYPKIEGNVVLNAYTTPWKYTINFAKGIADSGTMNPSSISCAYGKNCDLLDNKFQKRGYDFDKWTLAYNGTNLQFNNKENIWSKMQPLITKDGLSFIATATFKVINYSITYSLGGGAVSGNPSTYNVNSNNITLNNPYLSNHLFDGWTGSNGSTKQTTVTIPKGSIGNKSYTANWYQICSSTYWHQRFPTDKEIADHGNSVRKLSNTNTYKWVHNASGDVCTGDEPKREYIFTGVVCKCALDSRTGKFCGNVDYKDVTNQTHFSGKAHIYYNDSDNGRKACKGVFNVNSYVKRVCKSFTPDGSTSYHGYIFYHGQVGTYNSFSPSSYWTHSGGQYNNRVSSSASATEACKKVCSIVYP